VVAAVQLGKNKRKKLALAGDHLAFGAR